MWIPNQQLKLKMRVKKEKTFRIKTNNQELLIRKQNESDATSWWIEFQKTNLQWKAYRIQDWFTRDFQSYSRLSNNYFSFQIHFGGKFFILFFFFKEVTRNEILFLIICNLFGSIKLDDRNFFVEISLLAYWPVLH